MRDTRDTRCGLQKFIENRNCVKCSLQISIFIVIEAKKILLMAHGLCSYKFSCWRLFYSILFPYRSGDFGNIAAPYNFLYLKHHSAYILTLNLCIQQNKFTWNEHGRVCNVHVGNNIVTMKYLVRHTVHIQLVLQPHTLKSINKFVVYTWSK